MSDNYLLFARKNIQIGGSASLAVSYTRVSDSSSYTPVKGDFLVVFANSTKSASGNPTLTTPSGWILAGQSPSPNNNATLNNAAFLLCRPADGTATDSPSITVSTTGTPIWQLETYVIKGVDTRFCPSSPASIPQTGTGSVLATSNPGVALTTVAPDEIVMSFLGWRGPLGATAVVWTNSTADLAITQLGSTNNYIAVGIQRKSAPGSITPSASWTGGSGVVSTIISIGIRMLPDAVGSVGA